MNKRGVTYYMKEKVNRVALTILLVLPIFAYTQEHKLGNWLLYIGNKQLNEKWNIHNEVQYRSYNVINDLEQLLIRTGLGYNLSENNDNILLGYGYILSQNYNDETDAKSSINEHRIFQQFTTKQKDGFVKLNHRYRRFL